MFEKNKGKPGKTSKEEKEQKDKKDKKKSSWVPKLGLGFGKSKKSKKEGKQKDSESDSDDANAITVIGEATFKEESITSFSENNFLSNPDETPIGVSDRDGMNIYGRPRNITEQTDQVLSRMEKSRSQSSQGSEKSSSKQHIHEVTISVVESGDESTDRYTDGELTRNQ